MTEGHPEAGGPTPAFCGNCGATSGGTKFCQRCGAYIVPPEAQIAPGSVPQAGSSFSRQTGVPTSSAWVAAASGPSASEGPPTPPGGTLTTHQTSSDRRNSRRKWIIGAAVLAVLVLAGITAGVVEASSKQQQAGPSYAQQAKQALRPLVIDNQRLTQAIDSLSPGSSTNEVMILLASTQSQEQAAQLQLSAATTSTSDSTVSAQTNEALTAESQWLQTASAVVTNPSSPLATQLSGLGVDAQTKLQGLRTWIPFMANPFFPSSAKIVTYVAAINEKKSARASNLQFSNQVSALLNQSTSAFQQVNALYGQLETAANGGYVTITLAVAEQQINAIIANRTSLAAAAQALNAPTAASQAVSTLLVAAFNASLKDDNDLAGCLNQSNSGSVAYIYQSCLSSTSADAQAATDAKQVFLNSYNRLRASVGQPTVSPQF